MNTDIELSKSGQVIYNLIYQIIHDKDKLVLKESETARSIFFSIKTSHRDYPKVLGKKIRASDEDYVEHAKRNFTALELIARVMVEKTGKAARMVLELPKNTNKPLPEPFHDNPNWCKNDIIPLAKEMCSQIFIAPGIVDCLVVNENTFNIEIRLASDEIFEITDSNGRRLVADEELEQAMRTMWKAIGKNNGKNISLDFVRITMPKSYSGK